MDIPIEELEALLSAIESFFGPDIFAPMTTSEAKLSALNTAGRAVNFHVRKKRTAEEIAKKILERVKETDSHLSEDDLQEFLDNQVHDSSSREGSDVNNTGQEEQLAFLVEELGESEVCRLLNETFEIKV